MVLVTEVGVGHYLVSTLYAGIDSGKRNNLATFNNSLTIHCHDKWSVIDVNRDERIWECV
jgi:hypothetical protein